ncbi:MAG: TrmH family RNA methyltransferase [Terriglobia bacterium]
MGTPGRTIREITSAANALLKVFRRALAEGVTREGLLAVEGPFLVEEALKANERAVVHSVVVAKVVEEKFSGLLARLPREAEIAAVPERIFAQVAQTEAPQGIAALVELRNEKLESVLAARNALLLIACGLQDPGNLGTIMRSAQAFGANAVVTTEGTVSPFNPKAVRASAGAVFHVPIFAAEKPDSLFRHLRKAGVRIVAADRHSSTSLADADLRGPLAILIGQEAAGLPPAISRQADLLLSIPIREGMNSLNAASAASVMLYEVARQREFRY